MTVCCVPIEHLPFIWPLARPHLEKPLSRQKVRRYELPDILEGLLNGTGRLWVSWNEDQKAVEAAIVTEIIKYPRISELRLWLIGGRNMKAWGIEARDLLETFARDMGCGVMTGGDRKGWVRFGGEGWEETGVTFEKRL